MEVVEYDFSFKIPLKEKIKKLIRSMTLPAALATWFFVLLFYAIIVNLDVRLKAADIKFIENNSLLFADLAILVSAIFFVKWRIQEEIKAVTSRLRHKLSTWMTDEEVEMAINALCNPNLSAEEEIEVALNISKLFAKRVLLPEMKEKLKDELRNELKKELMLELKAAEALQKAKKEARKEAQSEAREEARKVVVVAAEKSSEKMEEKREDEEVFAVCEEHGELTREEVFSEELKRHKIYRCIYCGHIVKVR